MIDTIILAGDRRASKAVRHENKAFLPLNGEALLIPILKAVAQTRGTGRIFVVGPLDRLRETLNSASFPAAMREKIVPIEQGDDVIENLKRGVLAGRPEALQGCTFEELRGTEYQEKVFLIMPSDIPLITTAEIEQFITRSNLDAADYCIGVTIEATLKKFYPHRDKPGIRMHYFHMNDYPARQNNLHIGRPLKAENLHYVEKMYALRHQTKLNNQLKIAWLLLNSGVLISRALSLFIRMQVSLSLTKHGFRKAADRIGRKATMRNAFHLISVFLGLSTDWTVTDYGGAALDVDHEDDLTVMQIMYDDWMSIQKNRQKNREEE